MEIQRFPNAQNLSERVAALMGHCIRDGISKRGKAVVVLSADPSLKSCLDKLKLQWGVNWSKVTIYQMTEYEGHGIDDAKSQRNFLTTNLINMLPSEPGKVHLLDGSKDLAAEGGKLASLLQAERVDAALCCTGATGHLAYNEPTADFTSTDSPYLVVPLAEKTKQELKISSNRAVTLSPHYIMKSGTVIVCASGPNVAVAVKELVDTEGVNPSVPCSVLSQAGERLKGQHCFYLFDAQGGKQLQKTERVSDFMLSPRAGLPEFRHFGSAMLDTAAYEKDSAAADMTGGAGAGTGGGDAVPKRARAPSSNSALCVECNERPSQISVMIGGKRRPMCRQCLKNPLKK